MFDALTIFLQGDSVIATGVQFGQGVRCVGGNLLRLYVAKADNNMLTVPGPAQAISARSASLGDTLGVGSTRSYQAYYRDPTVLGGCNPQFTWNVSSGVTVVWGN